MRHSCASSHIVFLFPKRKSQRRTPSPLRIPLFCPADVAGKTAADRAAARIVTPIPMRNQQCVDLMVSVSTHVPPSSLTITFQRAAAVSRSLGFYGIAIRPQHSPCRPSLSNGRRSFRNLRCGHRALRGRHRKPRRRSADARTAPSDSLIWVMYSESAGEDDPQRGHTGIRYCPGAVVRGMPAPASRPPEGNSACQFPISAIRAMPA